MPLRILDKSKFREEQRDNIKGVINNTNREVDIPVLMLTNIPPATNRNWKANNI